MNKPIGFAIGILFLACLLMFYWQSRKIGELTGALASLRQSQDALTQRDGAIDAAIPKQMAGALATVTVNPVFKGLVSFADANGKTTAMLDPNDGLVLLAPDGQHNVYISGKNGGVVHAGAMVSVGSLVLKDPPGVVLMANDTGGWAVFSDKAGPTILLKSDSTAGPTLLLGHSADKESDPLVRISANDKESSVQLFSSDPQNAKLSAQIVSNADGSFVGIQKDKEMRAEIGFSDSNPDTGAFASFFNGNRSATLGGGGLSLVEDKQPVISLSFEKYGGALQLDSVAGEQRIYANVSENSDGVLGLFGPNGRSTVIGHSSR